MRSRFFKFEFRLNEQFWAVKKEISCNLMCNMMCNLMCTFKYLLNNLFIEWWNSTLIKKKCKQKAFSHRKMSVHVKLHVKREQKASFFSLLLTHLHLLVLCIETKKLSQQKLFFSCNMLRAIQAKKTNKKTFVLYLRLEWIMTAPD